jgi:1-acyl-sn-glycerol-3-phosphate acyltransferase
MTSATASQEAADAPSVPASKRPPQVRSLFWRFCQIISSIVFEAMFELEMFGRENVPATGGVLLVSNHQSYLDPVLLSVRLKRPMSYLARSELFRNPLFARLITALNAFPVRLGKGDKAAIDQTIQRLHEGHLLAIFPEGHRTSDGEIGPIQRGVALVVRRADVPIIPVVIDGSFQAWPRTSKFFGPYPIAVMYGPALKVEGLKGDEIVELIDRTLRRMFEELRARKRHP